jgi:hypothetical protein
VIGGARLMTTRGGAATFSSAAVAPVSATVPGVAATKPWWASITDSLTDNERGALICS